MVAPPKKIVGLQEAKEKIKHEEAKVLMFLYKFHKDKTATQFMLFPILIRRHKIFMLPPVLKFTSTYPLEYVMLLYSVDSALSMWLLV